MFQACTDLVSRESRFLGKLSQCSRSHLQQWCLSRAGSCGSRIPSLPSVWCQHRYKLKPGGGFVCQKWEARQGTSHFGWAARQLHDDKILCVLFICVGFKPVTVGVEMLWSYSAQWKQELLVLRLCVASHVVWWPVNTRRALVNQQMSLKWHLKLGHLQKMICKMLIKWRSV